MLSHLPFSALNIVSAKFESFALQSKMSIIFRKNFDIFYYIFTFLLLLRLTYIGHTILIFKIRPPQVVNVDYLDKTICTIMLCPSSDSNLLIKYGSNINFYMSDV